MATRVLLVGVNVVIEDTVSLLSYQIPTSDARYDYVVSNGVEKVYISDKYNVVGKREVLLEDLIGANGSIVTKAQLDAEFRVFFGK